MVFVTGRWAGVDNACLHLPALAAVQSAAGIVDIGRKADRSGPAGGIPENAGRSSAGIVGTGGQTGDTGECLPSDASAWRDLGGSEKGTGKPA